MLQFDRSRTLSLLATAALTLLAACAHRGATPASGAARADEARSADPTADALRNKVRARLAASRLSAGVAIDVEDIELAIAFSRGAGGDEYRGIAQRALARTFPLIDPVWGGVYEPGSDAARFSKTTLTQADLLRLYTLGWEAWRSRSFLMAALEIDRYVGSFLTSPDGAFYAGQAGAQGETGTLYFALGDEARRSLGTPEIDRRILARENGRMIAALTRLYQVTGEPGTLSRAVRAAQWVVAHLRVENGGYAHQDASEGASLEDTLSMGRAFSALYRASGDATWGALASESRQVALTMIERTSLDQGTELAQLGEIEKE